MSFLKDHGVEGVVSLIAGIVLAEWIDPPAASAYTLLVALTLLVVWVVIVGVRSLLGGRKTAAQNSDRDGTRGE